MAKSNKLHLKLLYKNKRMWNNNDFEFDVYGMAGINILGKWSKPEKFKKYFKQLQQIIIVTEIRTCHSGI